MSDNVIILGAGFSFNAGIPLLGSFVETMWQLAQRHTFKDKPLSREDVALFADAMSIRRKLDDYHGRARFDDRSIEDILSLLSFNVLGGGPDELRTLSTFNRAIARTIELTCTVVHPGLSMQRKDQRMLTDGPHHYRRFWTSLIKWMAAGKPLPTIITTNYDLVLERSLLQVLIGTQYGVDDGSLPFKSFAIDYKYANLKHVAFRLEASHFRSEHHVDIPGKVLEPVDVVLPGMRMFEVLKLHGSVNFPEVGGANGGWNLAVPVDNPRLLAPISNKVVDVPFHSIWKTALDRIRAAKNIVIVGYSLPSTDMYMQYFLRAAVGPNHDLNQITVFDPILFSESDQGARMKARYRECFAPQLLSRLEFQPSSIGIVGASGSTAHFVEVLENDPRRIFF